MKVRHYRNSSMIGLLLILLMYGCQPNVKEKLAAAEERVKLANAKRNYSPPLDDYYPAMKEWMYWYQELSSSDQLVNLSFIEIEEQWQIKSLVRSFRDCYDKLFMESLRCTNNAYYTQKKISKDAWEVKINLIREWRLNVSDTITVFSEELDSLLSRIELEHQYFQKNCEFWQQHIIYLREQYGIKVDNLPCDIESIRRNNRFSALDRLESALLEEFQDSLYVRIKMMME